MKEKIMIMKRFYLFIGIAVVIIGFAVWHTSHEEGPEPIKIYKSTTPTQAPETAPKTGSAGIESVRAADVAPIDENKDFELADKDGDGEITIVDINDPSLPFSHPDNVAARFKLIVARAKNWSSAEALANPEIKRFYEILESEEYLEHIQNGATLNEMINILAGKGLNLPRDLMHQPFRRLFPTGSPADYRPEMSQRLKSLIIENGGYDSDVLSTFMADERAAAWYQAYFGGNMTLRNLDLSHSVHWLKEVRADALGSMGAPAPGIVETLPTFAEETVTPSVDTPADTQLAPDRSDRESNDMPSASESVSNTRIEPSELRIPEPPKILTEESVKTALSERFSPQRFTRALQTLSRYGPKEGVHRLKESDPEIAVHVERLLKSNKEKE